MDKLKPCPFCGCLNIKMAKKSTESYTFENGKFRRQTLSEMYKRCCPVRHGRWVKDGEVVVCSECGEEHDWDEYRATYCEDCSAKMDLEV